MPKHKPSKLPGLTPSWQLLPASIELCRQHVFSLFWLVLIPQILSASAVYIFNQAVRNTGQTLDKLTNTQIVEILTHGSGRDVVYLLLIAITWTIVAYPSTIVLATRAVRGGGDEPLLWLRQSFRYFWRLYGLAILTGLIVLAGLLLFIIPGVFLYRRYMLAPYYLVARDGGIREAMRLSAAQTSAERRAAWGTLGVLITVAMASSFVGDIQLIGLIVGPVVGLFYYFGVALRQQEINQRHSLADKAQARR